MHVQTHARDPVTIVGAIEKHRTLQDWMKPEEVEEDPMATVRAQKVISDDESVRGKTMHFFTLLWCSCPCGSHKDELTGKTAIEQNTVVHIFFFFFTQQNRGRLNQKSWSLAGGTLSAEPSQWSIQIEPSRRSNQIEPTVPC
jgi:hypothetical protein